MGAVLHGAMSPVRSGPDGSGGRTATQGVGMGPRTSFLSPCRMRSMPSERAGPWRPSRGMRGRRSPGPRGRLPCDRRPCRCEAGVWPCWGRASRDSSSAVPASAGQPEGSAAARGRRADVTRPAQPCHLRGCRPAPKVYREASPKSAPGRPLQVLWTALLASRTWTRL